MGADVNVASKERFTPCHEAMIHGCVGVGRALIVAGADVNVTNVHGRTALHSAALSKQPLAAKLVIAAGADPSVVDNGGNTALDLASEHTRAVLKMAADHQSHDPDTIALRREISRLRFDFIRERASQICFAMQDLDLPALITLAVIDAACPTAHLVSMHLKWKLIATIKHTNTIRHVSLSSEIRRE